MKKLLFTILVLIIMMSHVSALTSDGVTYDNKGNTEVLTDTLDELLREADVYKTGGSVTANQMLKGATGYAKGVLVTGTIESKGATTYKPGTSNQTIGAGVYLSGAQTIEGDANLIGGNIAAGKSIFGVSGTYTSDANAVAGHILSGKTAYVNGSKVTGTIPSKGATTYTPGTSNQTIASGQYLSGNQTIAGDADLVAGNILNGVNIFGVNGSHTSRNHTYTIINQDRMYGYGSSGESCSFDGGEIARADGVVQVYVEYASSNYSRSGVQVDYTMRVGNPDSSTLVPIRHVAENDHSGYLSYEGYVKKGEIIRPTVIISMINPDRYDFIHCSYLVLLTS